MMEREQDEGFVMDIAESQNNITQKVNIKQTYSKPATRSLFLSNGLIISLVI